MLGTRLDEVLYQGLQSEDDILEALRLLETPHKGIHRVLALGELYLAVLLPEVVIAHHGTGLAYLFLLTPEELSWQRVEGKVSETGVAHDSKRLHIAGPAQFGEHIVGSEHPGAVADT